MLDDPRIPIPPLPHNPAELLRWQHSRLRRRMLYGAWREDLVQRIEWSIGSVRREAWGVPDLSSNVFRSAFSSLAVLYDRRPTVTHDNAQAAATVGGLVSAAGLWPLMQRVQRDTLGMREMLIRADVAIAENGQPEVSFRPVYPDMVLAEADPSRPDVPVEIYELRLRHDKAGRPRWTYDYLSVEPGEEPYYRVIAAGQNEHGEDLSLEYLGVAGGLVGEAYPYRRTDGTVYLPYVLYHAAKTGMLFDPFEASELVEGSLNVAVLWTFWGHTVRQASWPQRYAIGVAAPGGSIEGEDSTTLRESIVPDPATVLLFAPSDESMSPQIGQWEAGADPNTLQEAIGNYERRIAAFAGVSASDVMRVAGDPRSGFALAITKEAAREAQRRYEPVFRPVDEALMGIVAALVNSATGTALLPEYGYRVAYASLPPSAEERQSEREHVLGLIGAGLLDRVTAYQQLHPGTTRSDAEAALSEIAAVNARYRVT